MKHTIKAALLIISIFFLQIAVLPQLLEAQTKSSWKEYLPELHGVIRGRYEYQMGPDQHRFEVRTARLSLTDSIGNYMDYKLQIDFSDEGTMKTVDAYIGINPGGRFRIQVGQMRVPYTIDAHRTPDMQYFANRSFLVKQVGSLRDVGVMAQYSFISPFPIIVQAGAFNGDGFTGQKNWHASPLLTAKAQFMFSKDWKFEAAVQTRKPDSIRMCMYNAALFYHRDRWHVEGEYILKHYEKHAFHNVSTVDAFANYDLPLRKVFSKISFLARYDYLQDHSDGKTFSGNFTSKGERILAITDYQRQRVTTGITLSLDKKPFFTDIRLNYENYFYRSGAVRKEGEKSKIVLELMVRF